jgi:hypothetical protein
MHLIQFQRLSPGKVRKHNQELIQKAMNARIQLMGIMVLLSAITFGNNDTLSIKKKNYNFSTAIVNSGSGQGMGYTLGAGINEGRKTFEAGLIFDQRDGKISGASIQYRITLGSQTVINSRTPMFIPYLQYHLLYQKGLSYSADIIELEGKEYILPAEAGVVATMGHYLATGAKIRLLDRLYVDTSIGLGAYFGSMDKVNGPGTWGIHHENNGFTFAYKIGFCYTLSQK